MCVCVFVWLCVVVCGGGRGGARGSQGGRGMYVFWVKEGAGRYGGVVMQTRPWGRAAMLPELCRTRHFFR